MSGAPELAEAMVVLSLKTDHGLAAWLRVPTQVKQGKARIFKGKIITVTDPSSSVTSHSIPDDGRIEIEVKLLL